MPEPLEEERKGEPMAKPKGMPCFSCGESEYEIIHAHPVVNVLVCPNALCAHVCLSFVQVEQDESGKDVRVLKYVGHVEPLIPRKPGSAAGIGALGG